jgi:hypothetical protein
MRIYGSVTLDPAGGQINNLQLENSNGTPSITSTGRIYFDTSLKKAMVWNGTSWMQISSTPNYTAGDGLTVDVNNKFNINLYNTTANTSGLQFNGGFLQLKVDATQFDLDGDGLSLKAGGVTTTEIAGPLPDTILDTISTAGKVAATAVEDKFLRNDGNDTTVGTLSVKDLVLVPETTPSIVQGKLWYDSATDDLKYYNGSGWQTLYTSSANVHSVIGTTPIVTSPTTGDVVVSIPEASASVNGYLSSAQYLVFASKQEAITFGNGLLWSTPNLSVKLSATNPALEFSSGGLGVKLKSGGGVLADSNGLYLDNILAGFQAIWNLDLRRPNVWWNIDSGGSWTIKNFVNNVTLLQVRDGTTSTSGVTTTNLIVDGDLDVIGDNTRISTTELYIKDKTITVGYLNPATGTPTDNAEFVVARGSLLPVSLRWNETLDEWEFTNDGIVYTGIGVGSIGKQSQPFIGQTALTFTHNLNDLYPSIQVYDSTSKIIQELEVTVIDANSVQVTFESAQTGTVVAVGGPNALGTGGSSAKYSTIFNLTGAPYTVTIPAVTHGIGFTDEIIVQVMDNSSPRNILSLASYSVTIASGGTVIVTFPGVQAGKIVLIG